jgi:nicotinamidase-related amidase
VATLRRDGGTCLLVIDLQVDVVAACVDRDGVLARTAALIDRARGEDVPVIFVQHQAADLQPGTAGWQFAASIAPVPGEPVVAKQHRDSFAGTTLEATLAELDVTHLVLAGAASDYCIRTTMQRAAADGYDVTLVQGCHTTEDAEFDGVQITGEQIVAHTNLYMKGLRYPGQTLGIAPHDAADLFDCPKQPNRQPHKSHGTVDTPVPHGQ